MSKNTKTVIALLVLIVVIAAVPLVLQRGAEFGGSDDAGSQMIEQIDKNYEGPWFTPILETALGGELPGELESLLFCLQTGIGVGIIAFFMGRFVERKKLMKMAAEGTFPDQKAKAANPKGVLS